MKIRSVLELSAALDSAVAWRKKELSTIRILISTRGREYEKEALRRAAIPLLYAHWEGFAKQAAMYYLELVLRQRMAYRDLTSSFVAIAARGRIRQAAESRKISAHLPIVRFLLEELEEQASFSVKEAIDTESNLSSAVLRDILATIDVPYDASWSSKELLIDGSLLKTRNDVAHGERSYVDKTTYDQLHDLVIDLLDQMKRAIENRAALKAYLRVTPDRPTAAVSGRGHM